jgi:hypothetical protein
MQPFVVVIQPYSLASGHAHIALDHKQGRTDVLVHFHDHSLFGVGLSLGLEGNQYRGSQQTQDAKDDHHFQQSKPLFGENFRP